MTETEFKKYQSRGAYHWEHISRNPRKSNAFVKARYGHCIALLEKKLNCGLSGKKVLDVGCGDGALTYQISRKGAKTYGIDTSAYAIQLANQKHREHSTDTQFYLQSGYKTEFDNAYFDGIICSDVIEHVNDPKQLLKEIYRLLSPGGVAVISTPIRLTQNPLDKMHINEWYEKEFMDLVQEIFQKSEFHKTHPVFWMEMLEHSQICRIFINLLSLIHNPFFQQKGWRLFALQYAICYH